MPPKKPKPQKVDLRDLLATPAKTAPVAPKAAAKSAFTPPARAKPKAKPKAASGPSAEEIIAQLEKDAEEAAAVTVAGEAPDDTGDTPSTEVSGSVKESKVRKFDPKTDKALMRKAAAVIAQSAKLDAEVENAQEEAIKLRSVQGAFNGHIEIGPLTLPNPGGGIDLLEQCSFSMAPGRRYGLIGRNGKGKSTLLRYMAARRVGGMPASVTVHYVSQEVALSAAAMEQTPAQAVVEADVERRVLMAEVSALEGKTSPEEVERLQVCIGQLEAIEADTAEARAVELLANLGFSDELRARKLSALSGGWRVRVALAAALFAKPDVLLLDEPTNHLSIQAVMWLSHELATSPTWQTRSVVVVSHDRVFVDEACTDMLHISGVARSLTASKGSYSTWAKRRSEQKKARESQMEREAAENAKLKDYAGHGFKYGGSSSQINMMKKMEKQLQKAEVKQEEESEELAHLNEDVDLPIQLLAGGVLDGPAVSLQDVGFSYPGQKELFRGCEMQVDGKSRIVFVGENGNGKTTLVKILMGELEPTKGKIISHRGARISLVNQHHADQLDLTMSPFQFMLNKFPGNGSNEYQDSLRSHLAECGVPTEQQSVMASALSGGQRSRVAMAAVSYEKPHILVMDEPTNNLDLGSIEALAESVKAFDGGVVLVSHDQYFVSQVAQEVWSVGGGTVKRLESFESYRAKILAKIQKGR